MPNPQDYLDMLAEPYMEDVEVVHEWSSDPPMTNGIFSSFLTRSRLTVKASSLHLLPIEEGDKTSGVILMVTHTINPIK